MKYMFLFLILSLCACQQDPIKDSIAPTTPKGINLLASNQTLTLSWTANSETDLANYRVYWGVSETTLNSKASVAKDKTTYEITELENDRPYFVALSAIDKSGNESKKSSISSATPSLTASIVLSSSVSNRTNLNPFTLGADVQNFPDLTKVEFYRETELLASDETAPYEITIVRDKFGSYTDSYTAKAINSSGDRLNSNILSISTNVLGELLLSPDDPIILAGSPATPFEAYLQEETYASERVSVTWRLEGPGSLSTTEGAQTDYTPPTTLDTETTATITGTLPDGRTAQTLISLRPAIPAGSLYYVFARAYWGGTDIRVLDYSTGTVFPSAVVTVNGITIPFSGGRFQGPRLPVAPGETVDLEIIVPEGTIRGSVIMPYAPDLTTPASGSSVTAANPLDVSWEIAESPTKFALSYGTDPYEPDLAVSVNSSGDSRNYSFTDIPANKILSIDISAVNEQAELTGPVALDSGSLWFAQNSDGSSSATVTTTP